MNLSLNKTSPTNTSILIILSSVITQKQDYIYNIYPPLFNNVCLPKYDAMKNLILLFFFSLLIGKNAFAQQHLISYELVHHYTVTEVENILSGFGVTTVLLQPEFALNYYKITYSTRNAQDTGTTIATGAIVIPDGISCPLPIMSYQHGTTADRYGVPSYRGGSEYQVGVIGASVSGAVVSMPDYLGLGDSPGLHPYIHSRSEASATIDLLRVVRELKDTLGYNLNDQLFMFGYSQGGHSTMAAFKEIETNLSNEFTVTACAPMSGPYDVSGVQAQTLIADQSYATPGYLPYVVMGNQEAEGNIYNSLSEIFKSPYDTLLPGYFDGTNGMGWINNQLPDTPNVMLDSAFFHDFKNDPNHYGWDLLRNNDLYNWAPQAPLSMYYCTADEQVFYQNSLVARDSMHALGATHVTAVNMGNSNHSDCAPLCFLFGFSFFDQYMDLSGGMLVNSNITDASGSNTADGAIDIIVTNGTAPYQYRWENPSLTSHTTGTVTGLNSQNYFVRVSDSRGCYTEHIATINIGSSISTIDNAYEHFKLMPNPAQEEVYIKVLTPFQSDYTISIIDMLGRTVKQTGATRTPFISYNVHDLEAGTYIVRLEHEQSVYTQKLVIQH